jgi:hypothetical protein
MDRRRRPTVMYPPILEGRPSSVRVCGPSLTSRRVRGRSSALSCSTKGRQRHIAQQSVAIGVVDQSVVLEFNILPYRRRNQPQVRVQID